jgi:hypothetical protein
LVGKNAGEGWRYDVLGIPRVNLNAISTFVKAARTKAAFTRKLPYEMVVVGLRSPSQRGVKNRTVP